MSLNVKNLFKRYGNDWILRDVSFDVNKGEIVGIFGPTGVGKTALLKVLVGSEAPNGGSIRWKDRDLTELGEAARGFTTNINRKNNGWRSFFGGNTADKYRGEEIDGILSNASEVVLLDDPFCGMDEHLRENSVEKLKNAAQERGLTVIFATSNYDDIFNACHRVAVLVDKDIRQVGTPQEVYDNPTHASVASSVGRNNIFDSRRLTSSKSDHPEFITLVGEHRLFAQRADIKTLGPINKNTLLAIRPENISISFGASFPADNLLKAVVTGVRPRGASTLVELDSNGLKLEALVLRLVGLNVGDECMLGLPPDRIQILAD